jgi:hypothetical protein
LKTQLGLQCSPRDLETGGQDVWAVLTDYDKLHEFIPNLEASERLPCEVPGRVRLRQRGVSQSLFWRLEATALLELEERPGTSD